jgi:hypothetical protein
MQVLRKIKTGSESLIRQITAGQRILPAYLIIGAAKCGTTSLYNYLIQHPRVLPCYKKEVHYFDYYYHKGLPWYRSHFPTRSETETQAHKAGGTVITGESSPYYLAHPLAPARVNETLPGVKMICMLRNPVDRAISSYYNQKRLGIETSGTFEEAIEKENERIQGHEERLRNDPRYSSFAHKYFAYLHRGDYAHQLQNWYKTFPASQILIIQSESFYADPSTHFLNALQFLGLKAWEPQQYKSFNTGGDYEKMDPALRSRLLDYYRPKNEILFQLIGQRFDWDH